MLPVYVYYGIQKVGAAVQKKLIQIQFHQAFISPIVRSDRSDSKST
jgi:hypothetical protein